MFLKPKFISNLPVGTTHFDMTVQKQDEPTQEFWYVYIRAGTLYRGRSNSEEYLTMNEEEVVEHDVKECSIEFNGAWERRENDPGWEFVANGDPFIFWINDLDELIVRRWSTGAILKIADGVSNLHTIRGWHARVDAANHDQGLVAQYKRGTKVHYRRYRTEDNVNYAWTLEEEILDFDGAEDVRLFRTNDYRLGFMARFLTEVRWKLTTRNWAGMGVDKQVFTTAPTLNMSMEAREMMFDEVYYKETFTTVPSLISSISVDTPGNSYTEMKYLRAEEIDEYSFIIEYPHPIIVIDQYFGMSFGGLTVANYIVDNKTITVTTVEKLETVNHITSFIGFTIRGYIKPGYTLRATQETITITVPMPEQFITFTTVPTMTSNMQAKAIHYDSIYDTETFTTVPVLSMNFVVQQVGTDPI